MEIKSHVRLSEKTSFGIGGEAFAYTEPKNENEIQRFTNIAKQNNKPIFVLGTGSNLLIADEGFDGYVLRLKQSSVELSELETCTRLQAAAGTLWDDVVRTACAENLSGIEALSGIPSTAGAAIVQNIGAYGQEIADSVEFVEVYDTENNTFRRINKEELNFGYRRSALKLCSNNQLIVTRISLLLTRYSEKHAIKLASDRKLSNILERKPPTANEFRAIIMETRASRSMLGNAADENARGAGCFFKNPEISYEEYEKFCSRSPITKEVPSFPALTSCKLSAAYLVERSGFKRGFCKGRVGLSEHHALVIINRGGATCAEVVDFAQDIQNAVYSEFGIKLLPEVRFLGVNGIKTDFLTIIP